MHPVQHSCLALRTPATAVPFALAADSAYRLQLRSVFTTDGHGCHELSTLQQRLPLPASG